MDPSKTCPKCGHFKVWTLRRNANRCAKCLYEWMPGRLPLRLKSAEWQQIIHLFLSGLSAQQISQKSGFERKRILRALITIRQYMASDIPETFRPLLKMRPIPPREQGSTAPKFPVRPIIGILIAENKVWSEYIPAETLSHFLPIIKEELPAGGAVSFNIWTHYHAVGVNGSLHFVPQKGMEPMDLDRRTLLNDYWSFINEKMQGKGGIRDFRRPLYLGESNWIYNRRHLSHEDQGKELILLLETKQSAPAFPAQAA